MCRNRFLSLFFTLLFCFSQAGHLGVNAQQTTVELPEETSEPQPTSPASYLASRGLALSQMRGQFSNLVASFSQLGEQLSTLGAEPESAIVEATKRTAVVYLHPITPSIAKPQPMPAQSYTVQHGDSFYGIAQRFNVSIDAISFYNDISLRNGLVAGKTVQIPPNSYVPPPLTKPRKGELFIWPVNSRSIIQYAHWGHMALDIPLPIGTPILAAAAAAAEFAGWHSGGYGYLVVLNHNNGWRSVYGHNSNLNVVMGQTVAQGELIAESGNTGRSTMPHLHLEFSFDKVTKDPCDVLPLGC